MSKTPYISRFPVIWVKCNHGVVKKACYTNSKFWRNFSWKEFFCNLNTQMHCLFDDQSTLLNTIRTFLVDFSYSFSVHHWTALLHKKSGLIGSGVCYVLWVATEQCSKPSNFWNVAAQRCIFLGLQPGGTLLLLKRPTIFRS